MLEAQQVGDMCFKYKKNLYNIAYVAGGLTSKEKKRVETFRRQFPKERKEEISNKSLLGKVSKDKKLKKKDSSRMVFS